MTTDLSLIARQLQRETEAAEEARHRLQQRRLQANKKSYASSNIEGRKAIKKFLDPIAKRIGERMFTLRRGAGAVDAVEVYKHLKDGDYQTMALITMKTALDVLGKEPEPQLQDISTKIGQNVQLELRLCYYADQNPELYKQTERFFHSSTGTQQRATVFKLKFNRENIEWKPWPNAVNHKIGTFLLMSMNDVTNWIERATDRPNGGRKTKTRICYTTEFLKHRDTILAAAESLAFSQWPMLCPPVDWTNDDHGGYLMEQIRQVNPLIRKAGSYVGLKQGDIPLAMLNNLQQQAYKINPLVLDIADHFYDSFTSVGKFIRKPNLLPPPAPGEDPTEEQLKEYKRARREIEDHNAQLAQKNWRTTEVMYVARKYANEERFYCPASFDYRGRVYFQNTALNPQGTDFDKSLLYFTDEGPVNESWISFHLANCAGYDKKTMAFRKAWAKENVSLINRIASDPVGTVGEWEEFAEPWSFIAAAIEYKLCCIDCTKHTSGLPIGIDATCSGLQHLAALTKCGSTGALVNCSPTDKPADAYKTVAEASKKYLDKKYHDWMNRKVTKRPVMCTPYGVTGSSARGYIRDQLIKDGHKEELREAGVLSDIVRAIFNQAIPEILPGPIQVMAWLKRTAGEVIDRGDKVVRWTTPSGFVVTQDLRKSRLVRVTTKIMGGARIDISVGDGFTEDPDRDHHKSALAPNVVHSMDASLLHLTFAFYEKPFTVIHDCVLGRSCDIDKIGSDIRMHFAEMYKAPVMEDWAAQVGVTMPDDLIKNTLDIDSVNQSTYFFS
jgi:DNA-directed RNA polymerase